MKEENTKKYLIDASFLLSYLLPDEESDTVIDFMAEHNREPFLLFAPVILYFEISNAIKSAVVSHRITKDQAHDLLRGVKKLNIKILEVDYEDVLDIALESQISFYDASYVALSQQLHVPLLTLDEKLKKIKN